MNFNPTAIKKSDKVHNEMQRLNSKLLETVSHLRYLSLSSNYVTIALLNVRSLVAKLPDIQHDIGLNSANILCFCETWLSPSQPSPQILDNHALLRCDRELGNQKGGVAISVPQDMKPSNMTKLAFHSIEILTTRLMLPNTIQLALVYRSPSVPVATFVSVLTSLLSHLSQEVPTIIVGDFNEDIMDKKESRILDFMSSNAYTQLVSCPTTDRGTLIDHVYYNRSCDSAIVQVSDTYYSDHDSV